MNIPFECSTLDELLGGGVEAGIMTAFYGEPGSGKTSICLQLARNCVKKGNKVIYIDAEGVSFERLRQICGKDFERVLRNILFSKPYSLEEQEKMVFSAAKTKGIGLVIVDAINIYPRLRFYDDPEGCDRSVLHQLESLQLIARKHQIPVVITLHVYLSRENGDIRPFGGRNISYIAKTIVKLDRLTANRRKCTLVKHRSQPEGKEAEFVLTDKGIEPFKKN
jgi:DNA repair protein RadB